MAIVIKKHPEVHNSGVLTWPEGIKRTTVEYQDELEIVETEADRKARLEMEAELNEEEATKGS